MTVSGRISFVGAIPRDFQIRVPVRVMMHSAMWMQFAFHNCRLVDQSLLVVDVNGRFVFWRV